MAVDTEFGLVLGRQPEALSTDGNGPQIYFVQDMLSLNVRLMTVYSLSPKVSMNGFWKTMPQKTTCFLPARDLFQIKVAPNGKCSSMVVR